MGMMDRVRSLFAPAPTSRSYYPDDDGWGYGWPGTPGLPYMTYGQPDREVIGPGYLNLVAGAYAGNPAVFALMQVRQLLFSEVRFFFQRRKDGIAGDPFTTSALAPLENPWPGGTTVDLLRAIITANDLAGIAFIVPYEGGLRVLRPDWVEMVYGDYYGVDSDLLGLSYYPGGRGIGREPVLFQTGTFAYFSAADDPLSPHAGMSWLTPALKTIMADSAMTTHKLKFFEHAATPNIAVVSPITDPAKFKEFAAIFSQGHEGTRNAYRTLFLGGGADLKVIGAAMKEIDFAVTQGHGESILAAAAGVPPVIVGFSEGLQAATYSNYSQARRRFADGTMRPMWRNLAGSLASVINVPAGAELWYDDRSIPFLAEDKKDAADVLALHSTAIRTLTDGGYDPESVIAAVTSGDLTRLTHTGMVPVQLHDPTAPPPEPPPMPVLAPVEPAANAPGNGKTPRDLEPFYALIATGDRRAEAAERRADAAEQRADMPPVVNITPAPTTVTIAEGAIQATFTQEPAVVNVTTPEITVNTPETRTEITVEPADVTVHVEPTPVEIRNDVTVEPTPVEITNEVSVEPTPVTITNEIPESRTVRKTVVRNDQNQITEIVEESD